MQVDMSAKARGTAVDDSLEDDSTADMDIDPKPPPHRLAVLATHRNRIISSQATTRTSHHTQAELDSHADTCSFGKGAYVVAETGETVAVSGFIDTIGKVSEVPVVTAAVAYDDPTTYMTYVLFFHQSLYFEDMKRHLLCPAQMRSNQITVNDIPLLYLAAEDRTPDSHSIVTEPPHPDLRIPLQLQGTTSYFDVRKPTFQEIQSDKDCIHIHMTSDQPWDPYNTSLEQQEASIRAKLDQMPSERGREVSSLVCTDERLKFDSLLEQSESVVAALKSQPTLPIQIEPDQLAETFRKIAMMDTLPLTKKGKILPEDLARRWNIGVETAKKTLERTTQLAIRDFSKTTGGRRLKPYAYQLRYPRLRVEMYTDTMIGKCKSLMGNKFAQIYATPFHWITVDPMERKADAHYTLDNLFRREIGRAHV